LIIRLLIIRLFGYLGIGYWVFGYYLKSARIFISVYKTDTYVLFM